MLSGALLIFTIILCQVLFANELNYLGVSIWEDNEAFLMSDIPCDE